MRNKTISENTFFPLRFGAGVEALICRDGIKLRFSKNNNQFYVCSVVPSSFEFYESQGRFSDEFEEEIGNLSAEFDEKITKNIFAQNFHQIQMILYRVDMLEEFVCSQHDIKVVRENVSMFRDELHAIFKDVYTISKMETVEPTVKDNHE